MISFLIEWLNTVGNRRQKRSRKSCVKTHHKNRDKFKLWVDLLHIFEIIFSQEKKRPGLAVPLLGRRQSWINFLLTDTWRNFSSLHFNRLWSVAFGLSYKLVIFCWLGHLKMSFYYQSSHVKGKGVLYFLFLNLWSYFWAAILWFLWQLWGTIRFIEFFTHPE